MLVRIIIIMKKSLLLISIVIISISVSCGYQNNRNNNYDTSIEEEFIEENYHEEIMEENEITIHEEILPETCSELSGYECSYQQYCASEFLNAADSDFCCRDLCLNHQQAKACNYNTICEGYENTDCKDCQCNGVVCGGLCYNHKGTCCDDIFIPVENFVYCKEEDVPQALGCAIPGWCFNTEAPLIVLFDIPAYYPVGVQQSGVIKIKNNGFLDIIASIEWGYNPKFEILAANNIKIDDAYNKIRMSPSQEIWIPVKITALEDYNFFLYNTDPHSKISIVVKNPHGADFYSSPSLTIYKTYKPNYCGKDAFTMNGTCFNGIFYPDAQCRLEADDLFIFCANGFKFDESKFAYDDKIDEFNIKRDVAAKGLKKVFVTRINSNIRLNLDVIEKWTESFFDKESNTIFGRNMVDFEFIDRGSVFADRNKINNLEELKEHLKSRLGLEDGNYDFIIAYMHKNNSKIVFNESGGIYGGNGFIFLDIGASMNFVIAHEMLHGFGAPDLYFNNSFSLACTTHFINDVMCGPAIITADHSSPKEFRLYTAPFIGWADIDGDGIADIEDKRVMKTPEWFEGIEISEARIVVATVGGSKKVHYVEVKVIDTKNKKSVPSIISISSPLFSVKAYSPQGALLYELKDLPSSKIPISVIAEYAGYIDSTTIVFDPSNYKTGP